MLFRRIRSWYRWRKHLKKLRSLPPGEWSKEVTRLFPDSESPLMAMTRLMDIIPPEDPVFKYFHSILGERKD